MAESEGTIMSEASVSAAEVARFNALASAWWDPHGPMRPLHAMNSARIGWVLERAAGRVPATEGVKLLDVGREQICVGGPARNVLKAAGDDDLVG